MATSTSGASASGSGPSGRDVDAMYEETGECGLNFWLKA